MNPRLVGVCSILDRHPPGWGESSAGPLESLARGFFYLRDLHLSRTMNTAVHGPLPMVAVRLGAEGCLNHPKPVRPLHLFRG